MEIKVPFYNILNMFLTGLVFIGGCVIIYPDCTLMVLNNEIVRSLGTGPVVVITVCVFAVAYEIGLIINRAGSVIMEPLLKWTKLIPFNDNYLLFNEKKKQYPIMSTLSREYALSRTGIILFITLFILSVSASKQLLAIVCIVVAMVYYLSCRKHAAKIVVLMQGDKKAQEKSGEQK